jgi:hypothetical protein
MKDHKRIKLLQQNGEVKYRNSLYCNGILYQICSSTREWDLFESYCSNNNLKKGEALQLLFKKHIQKVDLFPLSVSQLFRSLISLEFSKIENAYPEFIKKKR